MSSNIDTLFEGLLQEGIPARRSVNQIVVPLGYAYRVTGIDSFAGDTSTLYTLALDVLDNGQVLFNYVNVGSVGEVLRRVKGYR
jgi:hypothetical protein